MVLYSTKRSLENREVSFLAIVEIFIASIIYWFVAIYLDTYVHIWISVLVAPFLLLRSNSSIDMGLSLFENGVRSKRKYTLFYRFIFEMLVLSIVSIITYILFERFINPNDTVSIIIFILFCSGMGVGIGLGLFGVNDNQRIGILSILTVLIISIYLGGLLVLYVVLFTALMSILVLFIFKKKGEIVLGILLTTFLGLGVALGLLFMIFIYKLVSIISNFPEGYKNIIQNWKYNNFMLDIVYPPELMYGIEKYKGLNEYKLSNFYTELKKIDGIIESFSVTATYLILYPFSIFYRFSIKATFWFYVPLLILVRTPSNKNDNIAIKDLLSKLHRYSFAKLFVWGASIFLLMFLFFNLEASYIKELHNPFGIYLSLIYFDFSSIEIWKLLQIFMAILTIILYFWSDYIWKKEENRGMSFIDNKQIKYIFFTNNIRNVISFFYFLLLFIYISYRLEIWNYEYVPNFLENFLLNIIEIVQYKLF